MQLKREGAMNEIDQIDQDALIYEVSDEAVEAATLRGARVRGHLSAPWAATCSPPCTSECSVIFSGIASRIRLGAGGKKFHNQRPMQNICWQG
jgi:hypothetical protein